jgi:hypothetical protein
MRGEGEEPGGASSRWAREWERVSASRWSRRGSSETECVFELVREEGVRWRGPDVN